MNEVLMVAAVTQAVAAETAAVEELIPPEAEITDPVSTTEEEHIPTAASPLPVTVTEEHAEHAVFITKSDEASVSVEEDILESTTELEMVQSSPMEDVKSSVETDVQDIPPAETSVTETTSETVMATEDPPIETVATEDVLVSTGLTVNTNITESISTEEKPVYEELETEAPTIVDTAAEETLVTEELVSETVAVEELISFENTANPVLDVPGQVQTLPDLVLDPLLDPLQDTMPVLKPVMAQEPEQEEQTTTLPVKPESNLEPDSLLQAEPEIFSPSAAQTEGDIAEQEEGPEGAEEPAEDLEAELNKEVNISF